ncbi:MAG: hypothetical protein P1T08_16585 [Acidimicrobiia bacterium]|nr:hypothetical protein [Acidimicrobiia bacterium]
MPSEQELSVMILVKAAPVLTSALRESMCVAAMSVGPEAQWIRLHPVPFRDLSDDSKFRKYQEITVRAVRPNSDRRPESWTPIEGSIRPGEIIGRDHGWSTRRQRVAALGEHTMCDLIEQNRSGSGPDTPSLAVVRAAEPPELLIDERDQDQLDRWRERAAAIAAQPSLFDNQDTPRPDFEVIPWRFRYSYRCLSPNCNGHRQTIIDWEAVALWRKVRHHVDWQDKIRQKFVSELWAAGRASALFVGNMEQRPWNFLVLGVFWPPVQGLQQSLLESRDP